MKINKIKATFLKEIECKNSQGAKSVLQGSVREEEFVNKKGTFFGPTGSAAWHI